MDTTGLMHWRTHNVRLAGPPLDGPGDVVAWFGAAQSQDYGPAKWSVGTRTAGATDADLDRALADGTILRTHVLRPTWHFVTPADIRWMLELTGPRVHVFNSYYYHQLGLDQPLLARCAMLLADALRGGNQLTRKQVVALLAGAGVEAAGPRLAYIIMYAELEGVVCSGALAGKQHTYALLEERAPDAVSLTRDEALAELTARYFTSHGPATAKDFRWWSSLTLGEIQRGLELAADRLDSADVDGLTYWFAAGPVPDGDVPAISLLQPYDEYLVGYTESKHLLDIDGSAAALPPRESAYNNVMLAGTQVAGRWKRTVKRDSVHIDALLHHPFDAARTDALHAAAASHGEFLGLPATVSVEHWDVQ